MTCHFGFRIGAQSANPSLCTRKLLVRGQAFTLIELLIVVAMLSILSGAFFTIVMFTVRAEAEDGLRSMLQQEGLGAIRAILRDTHIARSAGDSIGDVRSDSQTLILRLEGAGKRSGWAIAYRLKGPRLERLVWTDTATTPTVQTLSDHVHLWRVERSGDLLQVKLDLAINRYTRDFTKSYRFATRVRGVYE